MKVYLLVMLLAAFICPGSNKLSINTSEYESLSNSTLTSVNPTNITGDDGWSPATDAAKLTAFSNLNTGWLYPGTGNDLLWLNCSFGTIVCDYAFQVIVKLETDAYIVDDYNYYLEVGYLINETFTELYEYNSTYPIIAGSLYNWLINETITANDDLQLCFLGRNGYASDPGQPRFLKVDYVELVHYNIDTIYLNTTVLVTTEKEVKKKISIPPDLIDFVEQFGWYILASAIAIVTGVIKLLYDLRQERNKHNKKTNWLQRLLQQ